MLSLRELHDIITLVLDQMNQGFRSANLGEVCSQQHVFFRFAQLIIAHTETSAGAQIDLIDIVKQK